MDRQVLRILGIRVGGICRVTIEEIDIYISSVYPQTSPRGWWGLLEKNNNAGN
jgi:hypothetical protein